METDIQLPAGISLIPAVRKPVKSSDNEPDKNPSSDSSSNTDVSLGDDINLSPVKNIQKRKHADEEKPSKKYKNSDKNENCDDTHSDYEDDESSSENHDKSSETDFSKDSIPDILSKLGTVLQENNIVLSKNDKTSESQASADPERETKDSINSNDGNDKPTSSSDNDKNNDDLEFDITEKLREMGEISVKPVKKGFGDQVSAKRNDTEDEVSVEIATKDGDDEEQCSAERKVGNLRRNIREVMDDQQLDAATLSAQREEMERLARVQEQQKIIREVQRQIALNRQNNKTQTRVLSLLQGNTSLLKQNSSSSGQKVSIPGTGTVLVKIPSKGVQKPGPNLTPSISIAPVKSSVKVEYRSSDSEPDIDVKPIIYDHDIKKGKKDVVTIVDSSSDDDCIILSDDEEPEEEPEEDTQNSGLHVNDAYNTPDEQGRVVINIGHPEGDSDIFLAPQIARVIKPHQIGGVRFLFDNIIESVERFNSSTGFGCILAHSMGLGKTLQLVCFCDIFLRHTSSKTVLCIMPINTLQNWMAEFNMWLPIDAETSPLRIHGEVRPRNFNLHVLNDSHKTLTARAKVIQDWTRDGGVLLIGYELYRLLSLKKMSKPKKRRGKNQASCLEDPEDIESNKKLLDEMFEALVKPGPDLVICDEGHRIKNSHAGISMALKQIRSKRRIVLTGYPLQNNLQEYWCMVDFVRPNYLGTKTEFANMFERPIQNGQCIDSTPQDIRLMRYRAHVLHSLLLGFVQRRSHAVLQTSLPQKEEYVLMLRMTPFQRKLYDTFMNDVVRKKAVPNALKAFAVCCKIWNHPDVLYHWLRKREADLDLDLDDGSTEAGPNTAANQTLPAVKTKKGSARARGGASSKSNKKDKKSQKISPSESPIFPVDITNTKPSATIEPNSITCPSTENTSTNSSSKFFMPNSDNSDNAISFSNMGNDRNNSFSTTQQSDSNYPYPYSYPQNNYYPPKEEYRPPHYLPNQPQFGGDNYNAFQQQQQNTNTYGDSGNQYWGQNYYMNQQNPDFNYTTNYSNNIYNSNVYDNRYSEFDNLKPDDKNWNNMRFDNIKTEEKKWNIEKQEGKQEDCESTENCDTNIKVDTKNILDLESGEKKECLVSSLEESKGTMDSTPTTIKNLDENLEKTLLEDADIQAVKIPPKDEGIPYDWATELLKGYVDGVISNSAKMEIFFCILQESIKLNDRILVFSQSLFTLNLIEDFLQKNNVTGTETKWARNVNYYRLDGSTSALEREKLINEFNANPHIHMFLVSTRAGSLGINLVGANRVIVFDASWNPCHDTQAVCRVYRYGQKKPCFVYRLVMDNCLERKIYDRQINKQGMADRVVDECNPDAHLSMKEVTNLCWDDELDSEVSDFSHAKDKYIDVIMQKVVESYSHALNKEPFQHESLLIDRKEKKLSQAEKRQAQRGYELEKQASSKPTYAYNSGGGMQYRTIRTPDGAIAHRPVASVRPMQADIMDHRSNTPRPGGTRPTRWIPAEVWQRQGMTAQEMTLPLDVVIPTSSTEKANIVLKAGQKVMVLKSPKGIYMQLESGKIIAIKTAFKVAQGNKSRNEGGPQDCLSSITKKSMIRGNSSKMPSMMPGNMKSNASLMHNRNMAAKMNARGSNPMPMLNRRDNARFNMQSAKIGGMMRKNIQFATAKPYNILKNKSNVPSTTKNMGQGSVKSSNIPTSIEIDDKEIDNSITEKSDSKSESNSPDGEKSKESCGETLDSMKEATLAKESSLDYNESKCDDFDNTLCLDDQESKNNWLTDDISKLKLDLESENADNTCSSNKSSNSGTSNNLNIPFEDLSSNLNEDTNDKITEKEYADKATNQQITSLKNYRHKSSHKQSAVSAATVSESIANIDSQSTEPLSELEKTTSNTGDQNIFQASLNEITRSISPDNGENETAPKKSSVNFLNGDIKIPNKSTTSLESNMGMDNYNNMPIDNSKPLEIIEDKKKTDLIDISTQGFSNSYPYNKNNVLPESPGNTVNAERTQDPIVQQIHHFSSYAHPESNVAPPQSYPPPYAGYSYPGNAVPPYESMYTAHATPQYQVHDPAAAYSGLFHGHSAFHRPEPISGPGQDINPASNFHQSISPYQLPSVPPKPVSYPPLNSVSGVQSYPQQIQNYPSQLPPPQISSTQIAASQKIPPGLMQTQPSTQLSSSQMPPGHLPPTQLPSSQMPSTQMAHPQIPPQSQTYPNQNPMPNYQLNVPANAYGNFGNQSLYSQFTGNYPNPNPQTTYNARIYPTMEYGTTNFSPGYSSYPGQQTNNQWAQ